MGGLMTVNTFKEKMCKHKSTHSYNVTLWIEAITLA